MLALGALLIAGPRLGAPDHHHGVMLGAAAGTLFGVSDVAIKALTGLGGLARLLDLALARRRDRRLRRSPSTPPPAACRTARPSRSSPHLHRRQRLRASSAASSSSATRSPADTLGLVLQMLAFALVSVAALVTPPPVRAAAANATA